MSKTGDIKLNRELFLEKAELDKINEFNRSRFDNFLLDNTSSWGVMGGSDAFKVYAGTNPTSIKFVEDSFAINDSGEFIFQPTIDNIDLTSLTDATWYWLKISHTTSSYEDGTINVDVNGNVSGSGTLFLDVLRGQSAKAASRITLYENDVKLGDYEVISVIGDESAIINSSFSSGKTGLNYAVTGTFTLGETISDANKDIFQYDSVTYEYVLETTLDTEPSGLVLGSEFWIARIQRNSTALTIQDKRDDYYYKSKGVGEADNSLKISQNLADLSNTTTARASLSVNVDGWEDLGDTSDDTLKTLKISKTGNLFNVVTDIDQVNDITYTDDTVVLTGTLIVLKIESGSAPITKILNVNSGTSSNISYLSNTSTNSITISGPSGSLPVGEYMLYKTSTKWILMGAYNELFDRVDSLKADIAQPTSNKLGGGGYYGTYDATWSDNTLGGNQGISATINTIGQLELKGAITPLYSESNGLQSKIVMTGIPAVYRPSANQEYFKIINQAQSGVIVAEIDAAGKLEIITGTWLAGATLYVNIAIRLQ